MKKETSNPSHKPEHNNNNITPIKTNNNHKYTFTKEQISLFPEHFTTLIDKYNTAKSEETKYNLLLLINSWSILIYNINTFTHLITYQPNEQMKIYINFHNNGIYKKLQYSKSTIDNVFHTLYLSYQKYITTYYNLSSFTIPNITTVLYDLSGYPLYEYDLSNQTTLTYLKANLYNEVNNSIQNQTIYLLITKPLSHNTNNLLQFTYEILSTYYLNEGIPLFKISILKSLKQNITSQYDYKYLLTHQEDNDTLIPKLYPKGDILIDSSNGNKYISYSYVSLNDIFMKCSSLIEIKKYKYEVKLNGKFIYIEHINQYISRWFYTFNISDDYVEMNISIHSLDLVHKNYQDYYIGIIILKSNMLSISFVDYIQVKNTRDNFLKTFLEKGSYIIAPICIHKDDTIDKENDIMIQQVNILSKDKKTLSNISNNIIEEIFERFDIDKDGMISINEVKVFLNYIKHIYNNESHINNVFKLNSSNDTSLLSSYQKNVFKKFFYEIAAHQQNGEDIVYAIYSLFGYGKVINKITRLFYISVNSNHDIDIKIADSSGFDINTVVYELLIQQLGVEYKGNNNTTNIINSNSNSVKLFYFQINPIILCLMIENTDDIERNITLHLGNSNKDNYKEYKLHLKSKESKYIVPYFIHSNRSNSNTFDNDKDNDDNESEQIALDFKLIVE